jgi:aryl-alcohol dehydrogenase-like predicted oxidoreductase
LIFFIGDFNKSTNHFEVISKISEVHDFSPIKLIKQIQNSAAKLNISKFSAILFHKSDVLTQYPSNLITDCIEQVLSSGLVESVGASVYKEEEIRDISEKFPRITLFQVPENIMDRRLCGSSLLKELANQGTRFHIRSIFLQGLLLMKSETIPTHLMEAKAGIIELERLSKRTKKSILDLCLSYVSEIEWASGIVVGVSNKKQLHEIVNFKKSNLEFISLPAPFSESITDPRSWKPN